MITLIRAEKRSPDVGKGMSVRKFSFSLNGPDLFNELLFLQKSLPKPSFTECLALSQ